MSKKDLRGHEFFSDVEQKLMNQLTVPELRFYLFQAKGLRYFVSKLPNIKFPYSERHIQTFTNLNDSTANAQSIKDCFDDFGRLEEHESMDRRTTKAEKIRRLFTLNPYQQQLQPCVQRLTWEITEELRKKCSKRFQEILKDESTVEKAQNFLSRLNREGIQH